MADEPRRAPVRVRTRIRNAGGAPRLVADPAPERPRKRKPNSGSMKRGETRNPNGRPRGAKGSKAMARRLLSRTMDIRDGGRTRKASMFEALLLKELQMAFDGDWRARRTVLELGHWALPEADPVKSVAASSDETDRAILKWFEDEIRNGSAREEGDGN